MPARVVAVARRAEHALGKCAVERIRLLAGLGVEDDAHLGRGLTAAVLDRAPDGTLIRRAGVMAVVVAAGDVRPGDPVAVMLPAPPHRALECV